jgi:hypothetical protein
MIAFLSLLAFGQVNIASEVHPSADEQFYQKVLVTAYREAFPGTPTQSTSIERSSVEKSGTEIAVIIPPRFRIWIGAAHTKTRISIFDLKDSTPCSIEASLFLARTYKVSGAKNEACYARLTGLSIDHRVRLQLLATELTRAKWEIEEPGKAQDIVGPALSKAKAHLKWLLQNTLDTGCCSKH